MFVTRVSISLANKKYIPEGDSIPHVRLILKQTWAHLCQVTGLAGWALIIISLRLLSRDGKVFRGDCNHRHENCYGDQNIESSNAEIPLLQGSDDMRMSCRYSGTDDRNSGIYNNRRRSDYDSRSSHAHS